LGSYSKLYTHIRKFGARNQTTLEK
jgi:hypothetical protein